MKSKGKLTIRLVVFLTLFSSLMVFSPVHAQSIFRIGVIDEEDGDIAKGARLAVKMINESGGITGSEGTIFNLDMVTASPDNLNVAVANMNQAGVIAVVGPETTEQVLSSISLLQQLNVPVFTPAIGDTVLLQDTTNRIYRSRAQEVAQGRALADFLVTRLNIGTITTIQLDVESTASIIGLTTALSSFGISPNNIIYDEATNNINSIVISVVQAQPHVVGIYGPPSDAVLVYNQLRSAGYAGRIIYNRATEPEFVDFVPTTQLQGILNTDTWSYSSTDEYSQQFVIDYVNAFGEVPNAINAASYDAVQLIAAATSQPGELTQNLSTISNFQGAQGVLNPAGLSQGETTTNVVVTQLNEFGTPNVVARYINNALIPDDSPDLAIVTATPIPSATPDGFTAVIQSAVQNVRSGPSTSYDVLGQLPEGSQVRVIGATSDFTWIVIDYRGQQGWLATYLVETFGDRNTVAIIQPPPTPTPLPPTLTPVPEPKPDIVIISASPDVLTLDEETTVTITVLNQGSTAAGAFAVAATFNPGGKYEGVNINSLGAGQQVTVQLKPEIEGDSGPESIKIIADLNNQVDEGVNGEANNSNYTYEYMADEEVKNSGTLTLNNAPATTLDLEGTGTADVQWDGTDLIAINGAGMYLITGYSSINDIHHDVIDKNLATTTVLNVSLLPDALIGIKTADNKRGVMRVNDVIAGGTIRLRYRVYE